jgi:hypothetical protein
MADHTSIIVFMSLAYLTLLLLVVAGSGLIGRLTASGLSGGSMTFRSTGHDRDWHIRGRHRHHARFCVPRVYLARPVEA